MKKNKLQINTNVTKRALIVISLTLVCVGFVGELIRQLLIILGRGTGGDVYYYVSIFLSEYKGAILVISIILSIILFSNWIAVPNYEGVAEILKEHVDLDGSTKEVKLAKNMIALEDEINQINKDIAYTKQLAKEAVQRKDELVVYLAHDIRTPLSSVLGYLSLLDENDDLTQEQRQRFIDISLSKSEKIQLLVDELFEITRYNVTSIELKSENVNVTLLIEQIVGELMNEIDEKDLKVNIVELTSKQVFVDPQKISRVFENILVNAIRYTPSGNSIDISIEESNNQLIIQFENHGTTIDDAALSRVFEHFYRGDASRQSHTGGSGLGLAIAKSIVEASGGQIRAFNEIQSVVFEVVLPI